MSKLQDNVQNMSKLCPYCVKNFRQIYEQLLASFYFQFTPLPCLPICQKENMLVSKNSSWGNIVVHGFKWQYLLVIYKTFQYLNLILYHYNFWNFISFLLYGPIWLINIYLHLDYTFSVKGWTDRRVSTFHLPYCPCLPTSLKVNVNMLVNTKSIWNWSPPEMDRQGALREHASGGWMSGQILVGACVVRVVGYMCP